MQLSQRQRTSYWMGLIALGLGCAACANESSNAPDEHRSAQATDSGVDAAAEDEAAEAAEPARERTADASESEAHPPVDAGSQGSADMARAANDPERAKPPEADAAPDEKEQPDAPKQSSDAGAMQPTEPVSPAAPDFTWQLPEGFPEPFIPDDNPMSVAKVELGRHLFYDQRLSDNQTQACASCHKQALAFTDGRAVGLGSTGKLSTRGSPSIVNLAWATSLTWANPLFAIGVLPDPLERQSQLPLYGDSPVELGQKSQATLIARLKEVEIYRELFARAFPYDAEQVSAYNVGRALAAFQRTIVSGDSRFDRFMAGEESALTESEQRGYRLFESDRLECGSCHSGFNLTEHVQWVGKEPIELVYRNTGLYNIDGMGAYPEPNTGAFNVTMNPDDMGKFRVPTLRNIALTAPYMHDGSITTLSEVIDHYAAGGRTISDGPNAGVGSDNPLKDRRIHGFELSDAERADLIAFLGSLTDYALINSPKYSDPWPAK